MDEKVGAKPQVWLSARHMELSVCSYEEYLGNLVAVDVV